MKILIADKLPDSSMENLKKIGCEISYKADLKSEDLADEIVNNEGLIVRSTKVNKDVLEAGKYLQLIIRAGAGTNTIDVATASDKGVFVANCPGKNAVAVAELSLAFILAMDRKIDKANMDLKEGNWTAQRCRSAQCAQSDRARVGHGRRF